MKETSCKTFHHMGGPREKLWTPFRSANVNVRAPYPCFFYRHNPRQTSGNGTARMISGTHSFDWDLTVEVAGGCGLVEGPTCALLNTCEESRQTR